MIPALRTARTIASVLCRPAARLTAAASPLPLAAAQAVRQFSVSGRLANRDKTGLRSQVCAVLGAQWGDEGKGKLVDVLAQRYDIIARFNGGSNAGHTLVVDGKKFAFHLLPCGLLYPGKINVIGNGVVVHVPTLLKELDNLHKAGIDTKGRLKISDRAHLLFDFHQSLDAAMEVAKGSSSIGTTRKGIGPCYATKAFRNGVRVGELANFETFEANYRKLAQFVKSRFGVEINEAEELARYKDYAAILKPMIVDTAQYVNSQYDLGKTILAEGANATLLDIDHGTYPFVTSSSTSAGGLCTGLGISPVLLDSSIGVVKAYTTRVGAGPFPTELDNPIGEHLRKLGHEFGTTTGRPRRCGWLDIPVVAYSNSLNRYQSINITKLDVLSQLPEIKIGVAYRMNGERLPTSLMPGQLADLAKVEVEYETLPGWQSDISKAKNFDELPLAAQKYLRRVEELLDIPVSWIGVGPGRDAMITNGFNA